MGMDACAHLCVVFAMIHDDLWTPVPACLHVSGQIFTHLAGQPEVTDLHLACLQQNVCTLSHKRARYCMAAPLTYGAAWWMYYNALSTRMQAVDYEVWSGASGLNAPGRGSLEAQ